MADCSCEPTIEAVQFLPETHFPPAAALILLVDTETEAEETEDDRSYFGIFSLGNICLSKANARLH